LDFFAGASERNCLEGAPPPLLDLALETFGAGMKGTRRQREKHARLLEKRQSEAAAAAAAAAAAGSHVTKRKIIRAFIYN
jgi:hypothetical protein